MNSIEIDQNLEKIKESFNQTVEKIRIRKKIKIKIKINRMTG